MRIAVGVPPLEDPRGHHQTMSNRQYQLFVHKAYIYPPVVASAATMLKNAGHEVLWADGEAEEQSFIEYQNRLMLFKPDLVAFEIKTPSAIGTYKRINELKQSLHKTKFVIFGDHATALPEEAAQHADYVLKGGDYDFSLVELVAGLERDVPLQSGVYDFGTASRLDSLPIIDRKLTKWWLYAGKKGSGNYKYLPGTHTYWGRDCWWRRDGGCTFCSWTNTFKNFRVVPVERAIEEVKYLASIGVREVFDDTGTFPIGKWLEEFCEKIISWKEKSGSKIRLGCNMRPGAIHQKEYDLLGRAGFRFILYGLESAHQTTLDKINKGQQPGDMRGTLDMAKKAGLEPHVTCMVGYPWESIEDARRTIKFTGDLFKEGLIDTLQATICIPYPGTELYRQCVKNGWLKYEPGDWDKWDMRRPIMETGIPDETLRDITQGIYKSCITPKFLTRKVLSVRNIDDLKYLWRAGQYVIGHLTDFSKKQD